MTRRIRTATQDDGALIHQLILDLAIYEREPDAVEGSPAIYAAQLASDEPPFECLILEDHGEPAGFALFFPTYSTWRARAGIHLEDLFVKPEFRGRGHGKALLEALAGLCRERGCARLEWAVLDWNKPALDFYDALGAGPMSEWITYRITDGPLARLGEGAS